MLFLFILSTLVKRHRGWDQKDIESGNFPPQNCSSDATKTSNISSSTSINYYLKGKKKRKKEENHTDFN